MYQNDVDNELLLQAEAIVKNEVNKNLSYAVGRLIQDVRYAEELSPALSKECLLTPLIDRGVVLAQRPNGWVYRYDREVSQVFDTEEDAMDAAALQFGVDPDYIAALEHYDVSDWLASELERRGELIVRNFLGTFNVWGRTTCGQAIYLDDVLLDIAGCVASSKSDGDSVITETVTNTVNSLLTYGLFGVARGGSWPFETPHGDGSQFDILESGLQLRIFMHAPNAEEAQAARRGRVRFALWEQGDVIFLLYKFGECPWSDSPFSIHAYSPERQWVPEVAPGTRLSVFVTLVDSATRTVQALRMVTLGEETSRVLCQLVQKQASHPMSAAEYHRRAARLQQRWSTNQMAKQALVNELGGV